MTAIEYLLCFGKPRAATCLGLELYKYWFVGVELDYKLYIFRRCLSFLSSRSVQTATLITSRWINQLLCLYCAVMSCNIQRWSPMKAINLVSIKPSLSRGEVVCNICALPHSPLCAQFIFDQYAITGLLPEGEPVLFWEFGPLQHRP